MQKVIQQLIADRARISRATVSRCFTNHPGINPETRAKVFRLATELGYRHMEMRTGWKGKKIGPETVGILVCKNSEAHPIPNQQSSFEAIYSGICKYAKSHELRLDLRYVNPAETSLSETSYRKIEPLQRREWDGAILIYPFPAGVVDGMRKLMPVVSLVEQPCSNPWDCVDVDHVNGVASLVDLLYELGHRRIGFYTEENDVQLGWSFHRFGAFIERMCRLRLQVSQQDLINIYPNFFQTPEAGYNHVSSRVRSGVTAWVCAADHQALNLMRGLQKHGLTVPEHVSISGFGGIKLPPSEKELTTAIIPCREIGFTGAKRLGDLMHKRFGAPQHILVGCRINTGQTTARAASGRPPETRPRFPENSLVSA